MAINLNANKIEFGDFQTPQELSDRVCRLLSTGLRPASLIEPTCGIGNFLISGVKTFDSLQVAKGIDINPQYIDLLKQRQTEAYLPLDVRVGDFFTVDWQRELRELPEPILIIGNPPWVTNAAVGNVNGSNLPEKTNFLNFTGLDAITGKANFDISEWMLIQMLDLVTGRQAVIAMLCKTMVARKIVTYAWNKKVNLTSAAMYKIDAKKYFNVSVDACLLVLRTGSEITEKTCSIFETIEDTNPSTVLGFNEHRLIANVEYYAKWRHLQGESPYRWRSGIKHDCSKIMEFSQTEHGYKNRLGECVDLEEEYIFPMLKSSDVSKKGPIIPSRWMLVPQRSVGERTDQIKDKAPKTWKYLTSHSKYLDARKSSLYRNRPQFSIFGVGDYSFSPWKIGISGLYKHLQFTLIGPYKNKPVVLDDTCYSISCSNQEEAKILYMILNSETARQFFTSFIFWDSKRPITVDTLNSLDILKLASELNYDLSLHSSSAM